MRRSRTTTREEQLISEPRINDRIRVPEVRLVGPNGEQVGIVRVEDALRLAQEADLDLVEVAPDARPPVCKLMDYGKFKYESAMKARDARRNQSSTVLKEIRFRLKIDPHDYGTKKGHVERFLKAGDKVKIMIMFRGREQSRPEAGMRLLQRLADDVVELGFVESAPRLDGRNMIMVLAPTKKKSEARAESRRRSRDAGDDAPAAEDRSAPAFAPDRPASAPAPVRPAASDRPVGDRPVGDRPVSDRPGIAASAPAEARPAPAEAPVASRPGARPAPAAPAPRPAQPSSTPRSAPPTPPRPAPARPTGASTPRPASAPAPRPAEAARPAPAPRPAQPAAGAPRPGPASSAPRPAPRPAPSPAAARPTPAPRPPAQPGEATPRPATPRPPAGAPKPAPRKPPSGPPAAEAD